MANTVITDSSTLQKWSKDFLKDYVRASQFAREMGSSEDSVIRIDTSLSKGKGTIVHVPHIAALRVDGVTGATQMVGTEENLANFSFNIRTTHYRKAVTIQKSETVKTEIDFLNAAKIALKDHFARKLRSDIIVGLQGINIQAANNSDGTPGEDTFKSYANALAAERNAWQVANSDRVIYGAKKGNASGVNATDLAKLTYAADRMTPALVSLAKRVAQNSGNTAGNKIQPVMLKDGREMYLFYMDSNAFRDLRNDTNMMAANRDAADRGKDNVIFAAGDLVWDNVICREVQEIPTLGAVGNATGNNGATGVGTVGTAFMCGRGAITLSWTQEPTPVFQQLDYDFSQGVGLEEVRSLASNTGLKTSFGGKQYGVVTVFHSSEADA